MLEKEIIEKFNYRYLNVKSNNYIFYDFENLGILDKLPDKCNIDIVEIDTDIKVAQNIKIDLKRVKIKDILSYTLNVLKDRKLLEIDISELELNDKFDLLRFQRILRDNGIVVQLIFYNIEELSIQEQMLFNEIYYFNSIYFNANSFIKNDNFQTYFLKENRILDDRENYTKIRNDEFDKKRHAKILKKIKNISELK